MHTRKNMKNLRGGTGGSIINPAPYENSGVQLTPGGIKTLPNTVANPTDFSNSAAKVAGRGCAGTKLKTVAAKGMYKPYDSMKGGSNLVRLQKNPLVSHVTGPRAGYAAIGPGSVFNPKDLTNLESLGAGPIAGSGVGASKTAAPITGGGKKRRRSMKRKKNKHKKNKTRKHSSRKHTKRHCKKKHRSRTARRRHRGGAPQPYSNVPIAHGYGLGAPFNSTQPVFKNSALANPPPHHRYNNCPKNNFVNKNNVPASK